MILDCAAFVSGNKPKKVLFLVFVNLLGNYMDTVANMLTTIVNAQRVGKERVAIPYSRFSKELLEFLQKKGVLAKVRVQESPRAKLVVTLAYDEEERPKISGVKRISAPGRRSYIKHSAIPFTYQGYGFLVLSTPEGLMDDSQARKKGVGGELICAIW